MISAPPAAVCGADHTCLAVGEQNGRAVGGEDAEENAGPIRHQRVGMRTVVIGPVAGFDGFGGMNLVDGDQASTGEDGFDRAPPIFGDCGAVVGAAPADV